MWKNENKQKEAGFGPIFLKKLDHLGETQITLLLSRSQSS